MTLCFDLQSVVLRSAALTVMRVLVRIMALERKIRLAKEEFGLKVFGIYNTDEGNALHAEYSATIESWESSIKSKQAGIRVLQMPSRKASNA